MTDSELRGDNLGCTQDFRTWTPRIRLCRYQDKHHTWILREVPTDSHRSTEPSHDKGIRRKSNGTELSSLLPTLPPIIYLEEIQLLFQTRPIQPAAPRITASISLAALGWGRSFWNHPIPSEANAGTMAPSSPSLQSMELLGSTVPTPKTWPGSYLSSSSRPSL